MDGLNGLRGKVYRILQDTMVSTTKENIYNNAVNEKGDLKRFEKSKS